MAGAYCGKDWCEGSKKRDNHSYVLGGQVLEQTEKRGGEYQKGGNEECGKVGPIER